MLDAFELSVKEVIIHNIKDGVFFASLVAISQGKEVIIDARPSDAVAMAVRYKCTIFTTEEVLAKAGMILEDETGESKSIHVSEDDSASKDISSKRNPIESASLNDLNEMMGKAIASEDYELAARLRDEIEKRNKN
mgnify:FL=1